MNWTEEFPAAITVCDKDGIIISMNAKACKTFEKYGGKALIGKNVLDCHPPHARAKLEGMMRDKSGNAYTIEKAGVKKLIYQSPWFENGEYSGFVEISMEIPMEMKHFVRPS